MTQTRTQLPALAENNLAHYIAEVNKFPVLTAEEEYEQAKRYIEENDLQAAHTLVTSHLRLVVKMANNFRGYGLPINDIIAEGNVGLMQAVKKFDPDKGFRLSTYAMWWIKAAINEYILRSWSLVKMGTTAAQKKLFYNLKRLKNKIAASDRMLSYNEAQDIADELDVSKQEVLEMDERLHAHDASLNRQMTSDSDSESEFIDFLSDDDAGTQEDWITERADLEYRRAMLQDAMQELNTREQDIIQRRKLTDTPDTLEVLSQEYGVSRERIRQIEARALEKLQAGVLAAAQQVPLLEHKNAT